MGALIALVLQAVAPDAAGAGAANAADLRCLAAVAAGAVAAPSRAGQAAGAMYFVGRIDARTPGYDYQGAMVQLIRSGADLAADTARCSAELKARGAALVELSRGLQAQTGK